MTDQRANVDWRDSGVPVSQQFDDPYYSLDNGMAETQHVFLQGNDLPERFEDGFHVAELGFGTGLNFLVTLKAWRDANIKGRLRFSSFEAYPLPIDDLRKALEAFDGLPTDIFVENNGRLATQINGPDFDLHIIEGDARQTLPDWDGRADAWFLDGFSPAKNPELWGEALLMQVGLHTATNGTFATYTAAGFVRRALDEAGFDLERTPGFGRKRHMTRGTLR